MMRQQIRTRLITNTATYYIITIILLTILFFTLKKWGKEAIKKRLGKKVSDKKLTKIMSKVSYLGRFIFVLLLLDLVGNIGFVAKFIDPIIQYKLFSTNTISVTLGSVIRGVIVWHVLHTLLRVGRLTVRSYVDYDDDTHTVEILVYNIALIAIIFIAIGAIGISRKLLIPIASAIGIGVGFGIQDLIKNITSGLTILFGRVVKAGDRITIDEYFGRVSEIGLRVTVMKTLDNIEVLVPNADIVSHKLINRSYNDTKVRINMPVGVAYDSNVDDVKKALLEVAESNEYVMKQPEPDVVFTEFGNSSLNFELRVRMNVKKIQLPRFKSDLNFAIRQSFQKYGIKVPFPQQDVWFRNELKMSKS